MNTSNYDWTEAFRKCYDKAVDQYRQGNRLASTYFNAGETTFLASIGHSAQDVYDFAEDCCKYSEPSFADALLIAAVRRDFFLVVQAGRPSGRVIVMGELPSKDAEVAGFRWLPRIIEKARAKLRGEMPAELMYGCGGDRAFLKQAHIHPADFLRTVWSARNDDQKVIAYVQECAAGKKLI